MSVHKGCETRRDLTILAVNAQDETKLARKTEVAMGESKKRRKNLRLA